ncbi:hypothetical protein LCGC14_1750000 [marine sediment metagenome]|uniref:CopG-like ribbon-helix-helix domain-containing protein n=1 Tax=marine sediment metagenome TaxID=412755 RepID=A0A0F9JJC0_9ZZZZ
MKEIKVKLAEETYEKLKETAKRELRPITKQVTLYILRCMKEQDQEEQA